MLDSNVEIKFVKIKGVEIAEIVEFPLESDNTLSLEFLVSQFPRANELKYLNRLTDKVNTVPRVDDTFQFSSNLISDELLFFSYGLDSIKTVVKDMIVKKRPKETMASIILKFPKTYDLLVMGLSYDTTEQNLTSYLSRFGELMYCKLKVDDTTKESKGMCYFRFKDAYYQNRCLKATHLIDKTKIVIKLPKEKLSVKKEQDYKIYVYNISPSITREELRVYFSQFGMILDISKPTDKRNYAFITFCDPLSVTRVFAYGQNHAFNGGRVNVNKIMLNGEYRNQGKGLKNDDQKKNNSLKRSGNGITGPQEKHLRLDSSINPKTEQINSQQKPTVTPSLSFHSNQQAPIDVSYLMSQSNNITPANILPIFKNLVNMYQPVQYFGNQPSTSLQIPISTAYPPPIIYPNHPMDAMQQFTNTQYTDSVNQQRSHVNPNQSNEKSMEEKRQLCNLVNQFIQEIKNNLSKISNV